MLRSVRCLVLLSLVGVLACSDNLESLPVESGVNDELAAQMDKASSCTAVKFNLAVQPVEPTFTIFEGTVTGDLVGSARIVFDQGTNAFAGITNSLEGVVQWTITGGKLTDLDFFETTFTNRNLIIDRPGSPATLFENSGTHRATSGVGMANLTYHGTFTLIPTPTTDHDYSGVICL